jgi:Ca-activated chloride channel family protein
MPRMPASVRSVVVVGVGDPQTGKFIDGRQSRQDVPTLKQVAARLGGVFHNGNSMHLSSRLIADATGMEEQSAFERLTRREYALLACALGAGVLALLPLLLHLFGTRWLPGAARPGRGDEAPGRPTRGLASRRSTGGAPRARAATPGR